MGDYDGHALSPSPSKALFFPSKELQSIRKAYDELDKERSRLLLKQDNSSSAEKRRNDRTRTEGELELEFCIRKLEILRMRRRQLELQNERRKSASNDSPVLKNSNHAENGELSRNRKPSAPSLESPNAIHPASADDYVLDAEAVSKAAEDAVRQAELEKIS